MTEERFIAIAAQLWGLDRRSARACFHAADLDGSARLNRNEYLLFREAFIHPESKYSTHETVLGIRLRAVFHKYIVSRPGIRQCRDEMLTREEALQWVRDLCAGDTHVQQVADVLLPKLVSSSPSRSRSCEEKGCVSSDSIPNIALDDFVATLTQGDFQEHLRSQSLSWEDLVASIWRPESASGRRCSRVVLDGRAETATLRFHGIGQDGVVINQDDVIASSKVPADAVNEEMQLDPQVRAVGGWRGPLAPSRESEEYQLAFQVIEAAVKMAREAASSEDMLDRDWMANNAALRTLLGPTEGTQAKSICTLARACQVQLEAQPSLVRVPVPAKIVGDIHGQFRDLLLLFAQFGFPFHCGGDIQTTSYVFNGDFVDRGHHQIEVVCLLFALKAIYPSHVFLVRGNHEFRDMSELPNEDAFMRHIKWRLPSTWRSAYDAVHSTFDWLPLGALVGGQILVLHGGLGDGSWGLRDLEQVQRPLMELGSGFELDVVWSDPSDSDHVMWKGVHENPDRGDAKIHLFGPDVTVAFCKRERVNLVIRSHQYVPQGYKVMHGGHMITLFSARNYVGEEDNDGALLLLAPDLNGHLRVHAKRLNAMPLPDEDLSDLLDSSGNLLQDKPWSMSRSGLSSSLPKLPTFPSINWTRLRTDCGSCFHFMKTGSWPGEGRRKPMRRGPSR